MSVTADTITNEQIIAFRDEVARFEDPPYDFECPGGRPSAWVATCNVALEEPWDPCHAGGIMMNASRYAARGRIADALNASMRARPVLDLRSSSIVLFSNPTQVRILKRVGSEK